MVVTYETFQDGKDKGIGKFYFNLTHTTVIRRYKNRQALQLWVPARLRIIYHAGERAELLYGRLLFTRHGSKLLLNNLYKSLALYYKHI
jgi:hypothetical protein